tara:strand:- start:25 stop:630 length:606 start_codon:yes stop_codon:yes gene_type:complete
MTRKIIVQFSLIFLLILISALFYNKYFISEVKILKSQTIEEVKSNDIKLEKSEDKKNSNSIENLKYVSKDLLGNTYIITAQSAYLNKDEIDQVELIGVNAEIIRENDEVIYINSDQADYNKVNNNTIFKQNVNIDYGQQTINANIIKLNFTENYIEITENVNYINKETKINADKIDIDLSNKKLKISMIDQNDMVNITRKY